jgi:hypothetical protein
MRAWSCAVLVVAACGGSGVGSGDDDGEDPDANSGADATMGEPWEMLIERGWSLGKAEEGFKCVSKQIPVDTYLRGFRQVAPTGTHHGILTISTTPFNYPPDCNSASNSMYMLYGGGIGTQEFVLPAGVAIKLPAGSFINLNLHVANFSDDPLSGTSGIEVLTMAASDVVHEADMLFLGKTKLQIPPTNAPDVEMASCSVPVPWTLINMWPHMHSYATNQKVYVRRDGGAIENLLNVKYAYTEQKNYPMVVPLNVNDELNVECTYVNDTNLTAPPGYMVEYGESAVGEMCFTGIYKYPKGGDMYFCTSPL